MWLEPSKKRHAWLLSVAAVFSTLLYRYFRKAGQPSPTRPTVSDRHRILVFFRTGFNCSRLTSFLLFSMVSRSTIIVVLSFYYYRCHCQRSLWLRHQSIICEISASSSHRKRSRTVLRYSTIPSNSVIVSLGTRIDRDCVSIRRERHVTSFACCRRCYKALTLADARLQQRRHEIRADLLYSKY